MSKTLFDIPAWDNDVPKDTYGKTSIKEFTKKEKKKLKKLIEKRNILLNDVSTVSNETNTKNSKKKKKKNIKNNYQSLNKSNDTQKPKLKKSLNNDIIHDKNKSQKLLLQQKNKKNLKEKKDKKLDNRNKEIKSLQSTSTDMKNITPVKLSKHQLKLKKYLNKFKTNPKVIENQKGTLRQRMLSKLLSSRFRYLNEQMYSSKGYEAMNYFKSDPQAFVAYHHGYQQQMKQWPVNPLNVFIQQLSKKPTNWVIADMGCGDARLAQSIKQTVHSFDLVALNENITACDMSRTPLGRASVDVVIFCLSLMGTNIGDFLLEANRILKIGGLMKIAEVESRFEKIEDFVENLKKYGFKCFNKEVNTNYFVFFDFKKELEIRSLTNLPEITLNPCIYKKR